MLIFIASITIFFICGSSLCEICISSDVFSQCLGERYAMVTQKNFFFFHMPCSYIIYIELVEFCDSINIKVVTKWKAENEFMQLITKNQILRSIFFFLLQLNKIITLSMTWSDFSSGWPEWLEGRPRRGERLTWMIRR